jgi:uncharacterized glyoxalase superfamily protein PhnB
MAKKRKSNATRTHRVVRSAASPKRLHFITLGTRDLEKSKAFFRALFGWKPTAKDSTNVAFFDMGGYVLSLFPRENLAHDALTPHEGGGFSGITLAHNVKTKKDVAKLLAKASSLGAKIQKPAQDVFWGGHSGYFIDLDGHFWEVAWNPFMPVKSDGRLKIQAERY